MSTGAPSVAGQTVIQTGTQNQTNGFDLSQRQVAIWVGVWMLVGLAGLIGIGLIFRRHLEI